MMFGARRESFMAFMVAIRASPLIAIECRAVTTVSSPVTNLHFGAGGTRDMLHLVC